MDAIMGRFNSFNSLMSSSNNSASAEVEEERERDEEPPVVVTEFEEEKVYSNVEVELPKEDEESVEFYGNRFWAKNETSVD